MGFCFRCDVGIANAKVANTAWHIAKSQCPLMLAGVVLLPKVSPSFISVVAIAGSSGGDRYRCFFVSVLYRIL